MNSLLQRCTRPKYVINCAFEKNQNENPIPRGTRQAIPYGTQILSGKPFQYTHRKQTYHIVLEGKTSGKLKF